MPGVYGQAAEIAQWDWQNSAAMAQLLQERTAFDDIDLLPGQITKNSPQQRTAVLVVNNDVAAIPAGAALNFVAGQWGYGVQQCPVGAVIRGFAPGVIRGSSSNTIPIGGYFWMIKEGPCLVLTDGTSLSALDSIGVFGTAGQVHTYYGQNSNVYEAAASSVVTNTTAATAFPAPAQYTIPANSLQAGDVLRLKIFGTIAVTATPTLTLVLAIGATTIQTTGAVSNSNNDTFMFDVDIVIRTIGATGTVIADGIYIDGVPGTATAKEITLASTAINTTATQLLSLTATWSAASASNIATVTDFEVTKLDTANPGSASGINILAVTGSGTAALARAQVNCPW